MEQTTAAKRSIEVIMQHDEHLPRYRKGFEYLKQKEKEGKIKVNRINTYNIGSDVPMLLNLLERLVDKVDVIIVDEDLRFLVSGYLQHELNDNTIAVLGFRMHPHYPTDWFLPTCQRAVEDATLEVLQLPRVTRQERSLEEVFTFIRENE